MAEQTNITIVEGNLAKDAEVRVLPSGATVTVFSLVNNTRRRNTQGTYVDKPNHFNILVWGSMGEKNAPELKKGRLVLVEGRTETRTWEGTDGRKHFEQEVIARWVRLIPRGTSPSKDAAQQPDQTPPATPDPEQLGAFEPEGEAFDPGF